MSRSRLLAVVATFGVAAAAATFTSAGPATALASSTRAAATTAAVTTSATAATTSATWLSSLDPAYWTSKRLAAELTYVCVDAADTTAQKAWSAKGVGGITLLGRDAPSDIRSRLATVRAAAPHGVAPMIASDEEGGEVQRLANVIYPLPSAQTMGTWSTSRITETAYDYGLRMRQLGVLTDFGPVADLGIPGYYIASLHRAFSRWPLHVATDVKAWMTGMRRAGIVTTVKHWPGHGQATNTHTGSATIPPLSTLEKRDMIPFNEAFAAGVPAVMVGHLMSDGLTDPGWPATESPKALRYLRAKAGPRRLIITDSLSMAAATSAVGLTPPQAAVRALYSGADVALTCAPSGVIAAVRDALESGHIKRPRAVWSARRLMPLKARAGLISGYTGPLPSLVTAHVGDPSVAKGSVDYVRGRFSGGYRRVSLQRYTSSGWETVRTVTSGRLGYFHVKLPTGVVGTRTYRVTTPWAFPFAKKMSGHLKVTVAG